MRKKSLMLGTLVAFAVTIGTAFGINSVNAENKASGAEDLLFEEVKSVDNADVMCSDNYTWIGNDSYYTVIGSDGTMYEVDNSDGKYGEIEYVSTFSPDGYILSKQGDGVKLYNLKGEEAFGGKIYKWAGLTSTINGKDYLNATLENGEFGLLDENGNDISSRFYIDGLKLTHVGSQEGDYIVVSYEYNDENGSSNSLIKIYDKDFNLTNNGEVNDLTLRSMKMTGNYYTCLYRKVVNENGIYNIYTYYKVFNLDFTEYSSQAPSDYEVFDRPTDYENPYNYTGYAWGGESTTFNMATDMVYNSNKTFDDGYTTEYLSHNDMGELFDHTVYLAGKLIDSQKISYGGASTTVTNVTFSLFDENGTKLIDLATGGGYYYADANRADKLVGYTYNANDKKYTYKIYEVSSKSAKNDEPETPSQPEVPSTPETPQEPVAPVLNGLYCDDNGVWNYYVNGSIDYNYAGLAENEYGWWKITNGTVDFAYTGLAQNQYGWWKVNNGVIDFTANGLQFDVATNTWWYFNGGAIDYSYTGLAENEYGWWKITNGAVDFAYTGMALNQYGWWYTTNGTVDFAYTGMALNEYGWWYMTNGALDLGYTGMALNEYGWWYMTNGALDLGYTGMALNEYGWWYMTNGALDINYKGLALNQYGWWYINNGTVDFNYNGTADNMYGTWNVVNGYVVA